MSGCPMFKWYTLIPLSLALSDCILCYIPNTSLMHMITHSPSFAYEMMQIACKELGDANRYIREIAQKSVKARLAEILLLIASDFGVEEDGTLKLNVTREDLSNFVGTATETLIRLLSDLKNEGLVEVKRFLRNIVYLLMIMQKQNKNNYYSIP